MKKGLAKDITIRPVLNGHLVTVGCQVLAFNSTTEMVTELVRYLADPRMVEKEYQEKYGLVPAVPEPPCGKQSESPSPSPMAAARERVRAIREIDNAESAPTPPPRRTDPIRTEGGQRAG